MPLPLPKSIQDNLRFTCVEVDSQLEQLASHFVAPSPAGAQRILDRSRYTDNLKIRIHNSCLERLSERTIAEAETLALRNVALIATELDRIAELGRDCVKQIACISRAACLLGGAYGPMLGRIRRGIKLVEPAIDGRDSDLALKISQIDSKVGRRCQRLLRDYTKALKTKKHTEDLTRALFVAHAVERMGNALREIGEAIISANVGQQVDLERYQSFQDSVVRLKSANGGHNLQLQPLAQTRSGSAISAITRPGKGDKDFLAVFKDGQRHKVKEERVGVESWHDIYPGLAPKILSYKRRGRSAAMLIEHLPGMTFEQILLYESQSLLDETLAQLGKTLISVWNKTHLPQRVAATFMRQLQKRLDEVYRIHPEFRLGDADVCGHTIPSFDRLLSDARRLEDRLKAPFSVYIHGDFNLDNIIYDRRDGRIRFIDLHRSRYLDYVQDVSVFMVSNYRLQILDAPLRRRILDVAVGFCRIARRHARKHGDSTFELRLALGLARSFATSTRFILDKSLARGMFLRARYLIEQVLAADLNHPERFRVPVREIFVD
jgi:phosphate uptake regulator/aminoglycoside phosphotransferase (APT) family kinase protein